MSHWLIDAKHIDLDSMSEFGNELLHSTKTLSQFLSRQNRTEVLVVAPKGFGKTLLLKSKSLSIRGGREKVIPENNNLVDRPASEPNITTHTEYGDQRADVKYWNTLWHISIMLACLKAVNHDIKSAHKDLRPILSAPLRNPCAIFNVILGMRVGSYHRLFEFYNQEILPQFQNIRQGVYVFIDNVDEFFEDAIRRNERGIEVENIYSLYWYYSQLGLALAARNVNSLNQHIKVFASLRKEVFQKAFTGNPLALQLSGSSLDIHYDSEDLARITALNLAQEEKRNLKEPRAANPVARFFGRDCLTLLHPMTGDEESIEQYWIRHTLRRPRDICAIGRDLAKLEPDKRTPVAVKDRINETAMDICRSYLTEMQPHLKNFDPTIALGLLKKNYFSRAELEELSGKYNRMYRSAHSLSKNTACHVFCNLFKIGLLGYVKPHPESREPVQHFEQLGRVPLDVVSHLPQADVYLLHPIMDDLIARTANTRYYAGAHKLNIIGPDRQWREERDIYFVLSADVVGYSGIMKSAEFSGRFPAYLDSIMEKYTKRIAFKERTQGDRLLVADQNPNRAVGAIREIRRKLVNSPYAVDIRCGGDAGFLEFANHDRSQFATGLALRTAARLEAISVPGSILVSEKFVDECKAQFGPAADRTLAVEAAKKGDFQNILEERGRFNIAKSVKEEAIWIKLFWWRMMS